MKVDIEGGQFAVFSDDEDLSWLDPDLRRRLCVWG